MRPLPPALPPQHLVCPSAKSQDLPLSELSPYHPPAPRRSVREHEHVCKGCGQAFEVRPHCKRLNSLTLRRPVRAVAKGEASRRPYGSPQPEGSRNRAIIVRACVRGRQTALAWGFEMALGPPQPEGTKPKMPRTPILAGHAAPTPHRTSGTSRPDGRAGSGGRLCGRSPPVRRQARRARRRRNRRPARGWPRPAPPPDSAGCHL